MAKQSVEESIYFELNGLQIPLKVIREYRRNVRVAIGINHVILRIPRIGSSSFRQKYIEWAKEWFRKQLLKKPELINRFKSRAYLQDGIFKINQTFYEIDRIFTNQKTVKAGIRQNKLIIKLPHNMLVPSSPAISQAVSNAMGKFHIDRICSRVDFYNDHYFQESIMGVRLKYNKSNWGSCSKRRNINISTRLLFAPHDVQDYVIIHELSHLKEMNHSAKFWQIVADVYPEYKAAEKWLKANSHRCYY